MMLAGVRSGDGLAKISRVLKSNTNGLDNSLPRQNTKLNKVSKVSFCVDEANKDILDKDKTTLYAVRTNVGILVKTTEAKRQRKDNGFYHANHFLYLTLLI